jgi:hypothetical protein
MMLRVLAAAHGVGKIFVPIMLLNGHLYGFAFFARVRAKLPRSGCQRKPLGVSRSEKRLSSTINPQPETTKGALDRSLA